ASSHAAAAAAAPPHLETMNLISKQHQQQQLQQQYPLHLLTSELTGFNYYDSNNNEQTMMTEGTSLTGESMMDDSNCSDISDASKFAASSNTFNGSRSIFAAAGGAADGHLSWSSVLHPGSNMQQAASHHADISSSAMTSLSNGGHHLLAHSFKSESD